MLLEIVLMPFWLFIDLLLRLVPSIPSLNITSQNISGILSIIGYGAYVMGGSVFIMALGSIVFWSTFHLGSAIISWICDKLPFIG